MSLCPHRHLAGEVAKEWQEIDEADKAQRDTLLTLVKEIVPYNMAHNAEHEACDLLMEIEQMDMLEKYIDDNAYSKVCLYLTRWAEGLEGPWSLVGRGCLMWSSPSCLLLKAV